MTNPGQRRAWRSASSSTQAPIGRIRPVSSAVAMNSPGETSPRSGSSSRTSASAPQMSAGRQLDLRQEAHGELAAVQRPAQRDLGLAPVLGAGAHAVVVDLRDAAAALLGAVHGAVGLAHERVGVLGAVGGQRDADARADDELLAADAVGLRERLGDALGDADRVALAGDLLAEHGELVAAEAGRGVAAAQDAVQPVGDGAQQLVADGVAALVVDRLEAVEVEEEHRDARLVAALAATAPGRAGRGTARGWAGRSACRAAPHGSGAVSTRLRSMASVTARRSAPASTWPLTR